MSETYVVWVGIEDNRIAKCHCNYLFDIYIEQLQIIN